jgi:hypothetical protein
MNSMSFGNVERDPDAAVRRAMQRAQNQDGLPEIVIGVIFLTVAGLMWLPFVSPREGWISAFGMMLLVPTMIGGSLWAVKKARRRYLIEKAGYVEFRPVNRKRIGIILGLGFVIAAVTAFYISKGALPPAGWTVAGTGIFGGLLAAYAGRTSRFVIGGVIMALVGIVVGFSRVSLGMGQAILYGVMGMLSLCSGVVVLVVFLRKHDAERQA